MPRNRKYFRHGDALLVTSRTEEGLPLVPSHNLNFIIWGILAKARSMYRVKICHFLFMSNHFHMILVVDTPEDISSFVGYVKGEIAHAINKLLGRRQKTIWQSGYDSPILLEPEDVERYIDYIYLNPVKAGLVHSIEEFPGVSSWQMFSSGCYKRNHKKLNRTDLWMLPAASLGVNEQKRIVSAYEKLESPKYELVIEPFAYLKDGQQCFSRETIINRISNRERIIKDDRKSRKEEVFGATKLRRESMLKEYIPKKYSKRMICISSNKQHRNAFIGFFKSLSEQAALIYQSWKRGDFSLRLPPGLFYPSMPSLCSVVCLT